MSKFLVWGQRLCGVLLISMWGAASLSAQQAQVWIQVEARPSLAQAQARAEDYQRLFPDVAGYRLRTGWYAVLLGPYSQREAEDELDFLKASGQIPPDSYVQFSSRLQDAFLTPSERPALAAPQVTALPQTVTGLAETPQDARRSEALLTEAERRLLQEALQWAGAYQGAIDGRYGRGTRRAMGTWQSQNGFEATGILTTNQRAALLAAYNAVFEGLGFEPFTDAALGLAGDLPLGAVTFDRYEAPLAHFRATDVVSGAALSLISQRGDADRLRALYEVLETLEVMPEDGPRKLGRDGFVMEGRSSRRQSFASVKLRDGEIKGFLLQWPAGDEARFDRVAGRIDASLRALPGTLPSGLGRDESSDLLVGFATRKPLAVGSGFYVGDAGVVLTHTSNLAECGRIEVNDEFTYTVQLSDTAWPITLLEPEKALSPRVLPVIASERPRSKTTIAIGGHPYDGALGGPSVSFGTLEADTNLTGEAFEDRLAVDVRKGDVGGPVFDATGALTGLLLPQTQGNRALPENVAFSLDIDAVLPVLTQAGINVKLAPPDGPQALPEDIAQLARDVTVLVTCWE